VSTQITATPAAPSALAPCDIAQLLLLGLLWGGSFLFMRIAAPEFGPGALVAVRVIVAAALLAPLLRQHDWRAAKPQIFWLGFINSALPFCLFAYAALHLPVAFSAILNSTAALWAAAIGWLFFGVSTQFRVLLGILVGLTGIVLMIGHKLAWSSLIASGFVSAMIAAIAATACYGYAAHFSRRYLADVSSRSLAAGSQAAAALWLLIPGAVLWPKQLPSITATLCVLALGTLCTAWAYLLYFRLIERIGTARAMTVTLLVPAFGSLLGVVVLGETLTLSMLFGGVLVLIGCTLSITKGTQ
jgi:drug/metabolite transporter (DMT)-like permease